jgi:hypothetical protein
MQDGAPPHLVLPGLGGLGVETWQNVHLEIPVLINVIYFCDVGRKMKSAHQNMKNA